MIYVPSWWEQVSPQQGEIEQLLRAYIGKATGWRTPKRKWEDLWRLKRGELNHVLGQRRAFIKQRGSVSAFPYGVLVPPTGATSPTMTDITHTHPTSVAPTPARIQIAWDSDGAIRFDGDATTVATVAYATLTTQSDDANDHTGEWWPDQPDVNEGLNWDIRSTSEVNPPSRRFWETGVGTRAVDTWYLLDTVSNDHADASADGCIVCLHSGGTAKSPSPGTKLVDVDIEIRATGSGGAVATTTLDLESQTT